jgi:rod shape determining protein RodA
MGFAGSIVVIGLFVTLFLRVIYLAERQKTKFSRLWILRCWYFIHTLFKHCNGYWNLPNNRGTITFFLLWSSGLWGFTILLFIFLKMDANKVNEW